MWALCISVFLLLLLQINAFELRVRVFWIVFWLRPDFSDLVLDCLALTPSPTILLRFAKIRYFCIPPSLSPPFPPPSILPFVECTFEMEKKLKRRKGVIYESLFLHLYLAYNAHTSLSHTHTHNSANSSSAIPRRLKLTQLAFFFNQNANNKSCKNVCQKCGRVFAMGLKIYCCCYHRYEQQTRCRTI